MQERIYTPASHLIHHNARIGRVYSAIGQPKYKQLDGQTIIGKIITEYKNLNRKMIDDWRNALRSALDVIFPRRYLLQDLYDDLETDGHFQSQFILRFAATLGYNFELIDDATGEVDKETTKLFQSNWFYQFMKKALTVHKKGYTLLELINPATMEFKIVPRRNVLPNKKVIVLSVMDQDGIDYTTGGYENRIIEVGETDDLGLMNDIIPQLIWKRNAQQSWAEFSEKFGMPLVTATTSKTNDRDLDKLEQLLEALGESARAVLPAGTSINVTPFAGKDSYQVYDAQINRCNSEISKPIVGGTMATDNGSSRSQSEVHERNLDDKIASEDRLLFSFLVNDKLIPLMRTWGWPIPEKRTFVFPKSFDLSLMDHWTIVFQGLQYFDISIDWISKTFNMPVDAVKKIVAALPTKPGGVKPNEEPADEPPENEPPVKEPPVKGKKPKPAASFFD
ncbi:uncharacterized protein DUF935 [Mucilaginibacter gracilis]|uniref:Uncharacterized protein DUF935 n=1 Tax=Mucilaginibacter gracilis TaxID=423350 RepID=A0A495J2K6_9SPHI|nr:DUF935 family protein [Mucilaginibacter gracilis]RKR83200.1 uncharacterized protein DUF935 [Mucilaginibacter gracilis]